LL
ncbi:D-alanyl-D-alanine carboxypeptidase family protein, partial [Chlamydia psittaci 84-8471/1]|jgi:hypothetical protein